MYLLVEEVIGINFVSFGDDIEVVKNVVVSFFVGYIERYDIGIILKVFLIGYFVNEVIVVYLEYFYVVFLFYLVVFVFCNFKFLIEGSRM